MNDDYFSGRHGTGTPDFNNTYWRQGNQDRVNEQNKQQEAQRATERARMEANHQFWTDAMRPKPAPTVPAWATPTRSHTSAVGAVGAVASAQQRSIPVSYSSGGGYSERSWFEGFVHFVFAPFRWAWALIKLGVKAALVLVALVVAYAIYMAMNPPRSSDTAAALSQPLAATPAPTPAPPQFPRLGVELGDLSAADISRLQLAPRQTGAIVRSVVAQSPAARIALQPDDLILSLNQSAVSNSNELVALVRAQRPGVSIPIGFIRNGERYSGNITPALLEQ